MRKTVKMVEGLAIGMIIGGIAGAVITNKLKNCSCTGKRFTKAVRSACGFIENLL